MTIALERRPDWRERLRTYVLSNLSVPFRPGKHDCALFVAGAIREMTGHDFGRGWRGKYRSIKAGEALARERGYDDHEAIFSEHLDPVAPSFARVGDLAVVETEAGTALGIVQGEMIYVLHVGGMAIVSRDQMKRAYRV